MGCVSVISADRRDEERKRYPLWLYCTHKATPHTHTQFNEPNHRTQANLSPQQAAALWPKLEAAAAATGSATLVGPAVNWSPDAVGFGGGFGGGER